MIRSMTGFGRSAFQVAGLGFDLELRSVNHRYLDLRVRLPRPLQSFETELRGRLQGPLARGKVELSVTPASGASLPPRVEVDLEAARAYLAAAAQLRDEPSLGGDLHAGALLALPGVARLVETELPAEDVRAALFGALDAALEELEAMRRSEGEALERDLLERVALLETGLEVVEGRAGEVQTAARERLRRRAEQLRSETGLLDEARLHQEIVVAADRLDVSEELVRLRSHTEQFRRIVGAAEIGKPVGRQLDFLLQELGREANTIGSKASDAPVAHQIVELKTGIEQLREQVQNVE